MTFMSDALDKMRAGLTADAAAETITTAKAQISALVRGLNAAQTKARGYQDSNLSPEGLAAKRAQVASAAQAASTNATSKLPKFGDDAAAIARSQRKWDQERTRQLANHYSPRAPRLRHGLGP